LGGTVNKIRLLILMNKGLGFSETYAELRNEIVFYFKTGS